MKLQEPNSKEATEADGSKTSAETDEFKKADDSPKPTEADESKGCQEADESKKRCQAETADPMIESTPKRQKVDDASEPASAEKLTKPPFMPTLAVGRMRLRGKSADGKVYQRGGVQSQENERQSGNYRIHAARRQAQTSYESPIQNLGR